MNLDQSGFFAKFIDGHQPMRVKTSSSKTAGASKGKMRAKTEAKMMASTAQLVAYVGS